MTTRPVTGTYADPAGTPLTGRVVFQLVTLASDGEKVYGTNAVAALLDQNGHIAVELVTTDTLDVNGICYRVTEHLNGQPITRYYIELPAAPDALDLADADRGTEAPRLYWPPGGAGSGVTDAELAAHNDGTTAVHGIADTAQLLTEAAANATYASLSAMPVGAARDKPGIYFADHIRKSRAKLAASRFTQCHIGIYGHSVVDGAYSNDAGSTDHATWRTRGFVTQARTMLAERFGSVGDGWFWPGSASGVIGSLQNGAAVQTGQSVGYAGQRIHLPSSTSQFTIVAPQCTALKLLCLGGVGTIRYQVDGGGVQTASSSGADSYIVSITGLADTTHTFTILGDAGSTAAYVVAVGFFRSTTTGAIVSRFGFSGQTAADCFAWAAPSGTTLGDLSNADKDRQLRTTVTDLAVDLAVLMYNVNDTSKGWTTYGRTPTAVQTATQTLCNKLIAAGHDVLLLCGPPKDPASYSSGGYTVADYAEAYYNIAAATDRVAFMDLERIWGTWATATTDGLMYDYVHPSMRGHSDIAALLSSALSGR